jgi:hypothetical protein
MSRFKAIGIFLVIFLSGIMAGGYLFSDSQPRSFLAVRKCRSCLKPNDLAGLMASVGIQKLPSLLPFVALETDMTIAIKLPARKGKIHYVIVPKKDIRNIGELSGDDTRYLIDTFSVMQSLIQKENLVNYFVYTNGPGLQNVTYLHFHLVAK